MMKSSRGWLTLFLLWPLLGCGCRSKQQTIAVTDVAQEELLAVRKLVAQGAVVQLRLRVEGQVDGSSELVLLRDGEPYHRETLAGNVDVRWRGDWYHDRAVLHYRPGTTASGSLRISYTFVD